MSSTIEIIAHRGYSGRAPENTVAAIRLAMECGAPAVEWDMHVSASGTPHVFHDDTVDRTTRSSGAFASLSDAEVELLDAGSWFDPSFAGEPVPTLARALEATGPPVRRIYPEIKAYNSISDVDRMVDEVFAAGWGENAVFISMDWTALERVRLRNDASWVGYIAEARERLEPAINRAGGDPRAIVDPDVRVALAEPALIDRARSLEIPLACWTVNDIDTAAQAVAAGIPSLTTNEVETLLAWAAGL